MNKKLPGWKDTEKVNKQIADTDYITTLLPFPRHFSIGYCWRRGAWTFGY